MWRNKYLMWNQCSEGEDHRNLEGCNRELDLGSKSMERFGACGVRGRSEWVWPTEEVEKANEVRVVSAVGSSLENSGVMKPVAHIGLQEPIVKYSRVL